MCPAKPGLIIGFHGCDRNVRDRLVSGKTQLRLSTNPYDWLGNGIYFWENNQQRALHFARELKRRKGDDSPIQQPSVVGAVIDLGFCLDLLDAEFIQLVERSYRALAESCKTLGLPLPQNQAINGSADLLLRHLDCAVIQHLHFDRDDTNKPPFDSVL